MDNREIAQLLERAADVVDKRGYTAYNYDGCSVCQIGAIAIAAGAQNGHPFDDNGWCTTRLVEVGTSQYTPVEEIEKAVELAARAIHGRDWHTVSLVRYQLDHYNENGKAVARHMREVAAKLIEIADRAELVEMGNEEVKEEEVVAV